MPGKSPGVPGWYTERDAIVGDGGHGMAQEQNQERV